MYISLQLKYLFIRKFYNSHEILAVGNQLSYSLTQLGVPTLQVV